jgi:hypothetical protein
MRMWFPHPRSASWTRDLATGVDDDRRVFRQHHNFPMLLLSGNFFFVPASEPHFSLSPSQVHSTFCRDRAGCILENRKFFRPVNPQIGSACGSLQGIFKMIVEVVTSLFMIQCASLISRLIERRRDVLSHVSRSDPSSPARSRSGGTKSRQRNCRLPVGMKRSAILSRPV